MLIAVHVHVPYIQLHVTSRHLHSNTNSAASLTVKFTKNIASLVGSNTIYRLRVLSIGVQFYKSVWKNVRGQIVRGNAESDVIWTFGVAT